MTPERKKEIKNKLGWADVWDESKMEFWKMLYEAMEHIEVLEKQQNKRNSLVLKTSRDL